jgi:hypothetical protein
MKRRLKKKSLIIIICAVLVLGLLGFGTYYLLSSKGNNTPNNNPETKKPEPEPEKPKLKIVDEDSTSRPYGVMINNIVTARPLQSGLQDAFIIYEIIVEGGISRYMALFMDQTTERIGSIRSARHYFLDYALENDAIYVHHGRSPQAYADFSKLGIDRIEVNDSTTGWRDKSLGVAIEHTLFTSIEKLGKGVGSKRTTRNKDLLLNYSIEEIDLSTYEGAIPATKIDIPYSKSNRPGYEYDAENKVYLRKVNDKYNSDYVTKKPLEVKNIITYQVENYSLKDGSGKDRQDIKNIGTGTGYYITNGYAVPIKWSKQSRKDQTVYTLNDGTPLKVNDGNTFIQIQPKSMKLTITGEATETTEE